MKGINDRLYKNAVANGITKERFKFLIYNIKDMDDEFVQDREERMEDLIEQFKNKENEANVDASGNIINIKDKVQYKKDHSVFNQSKKQKNMATS